MYAILSIMPRSKAFRILVILLAVYFIAREAAQLGVHAGLIDLGLPEGVDVTWVGGDLFIHVSAAQRLVAGQDLYYSGIPPKFEVYNYTPLYALLLSGVRFLSFQQHASLHGVLVLAAYAGLFATWRHCFPRLGAPRAGQMLLLSLPAWLLYTAYWGDALLLNLYVMLALAVSWLFLFIWEEKVWPAAGLLVLILQVKPQWAFALLLPLLLGRQRFFWQLLGLVVAGYLLTLAATLLVIGPQYGLAQYAAYWEMLTTHHLEVPWHGLGEAIGYDHSIAQVYFSLFGYRPEAWPLVRVIKLALLAPLGAFCAWRTLRTLRSPQAPVDGRYALECFFSLYCAAFLWLDLVWEATLSIVIFAYLVSSLARPARWLAIIPFGWYTLSDLWQTVGIALASVWMGADSIAAHGPPLWADPSYHLPVILLVFLTFYGLLTSRLLRRVGEGELKPWVAAAGVGSRSR